MEVYNELERVKAENAKLKEALTKIINIDIYETEPRRCVDMLPFDVLSDINLRMVSIAEQALKGESDGK